MSRVFFTPQVSAADLREVLSHQSAVRHDQFQITFQTPYGERRCVRWLTPADAFGRKAILTRRGYSAAVEPMGII